LKTIAYLDCPSGIAGDMCLAALVDAGVPLAYLHEQLATLGLSDEFTLSVTPTQRQGLRALYTQVDLRPVPANQSAESTTGSTGAHPDHGHGHSHTSVDDQVHAVAANHSSAAPLRNLTTIESLITQANLPDRARRWSLAVFHRLAEAEAAVHGIAVDQVHFHEVGATDAIIDVVGTCLGFDYLGVDTLVCSPLPTGRGRVRAAHGWLPVPAPAVLKLFEQRQVPLYSNGLEGELVTPTGAAIATALADSFGDPPPMTLHRTGLGAGKKDLPVPNMLRLWIGTSDIETLSSSSGSMPGASLLAQAAKVPSIPYHTDTVTLLETQVDDMVPQAAGYLCDRLLAAGALDIFTQPIGMKKSRPGLLLTVICHPVDESQCVDILFAETPTLGIRRQTQRRWVLSRQFQTLQTPYGPVAVKLAYHPSNQALLNVHPEYEDCAALARRHNLPWQTIYQTALNTWYSQQPQPPLTEN
jgi:uncharacterized protein (TIGR00299 family) protein